MPYSRRRLSDSHGTVAALHLYILKPQMPMLTLIKIAWTNYNIKATLQNDEDVNSSAKVDENLTSEDILLLYNQLSSDLRFSRNSNSVEEQYELIAELCRAATLTAHVKTIFWKNTEIMVFIMKHCKATIHKSCDITHPHDLELLTVMLETLAVMFKDTDTLVDRLHYLKANNCKVMYELLYILVCIPSVLEDSGCTVPMANGTATDRETHPGTPTPLGQLTDAELLSLLIELTNASNSVMNELIQIAHQTSWLPKRRNVGDASHFNIYTLVQYLETHITHTKLFIDRLLVEVFHSLSEASDLCGLEAIQLYEQMFILNNVLHYGKALPMHIKQKYNVEFRSLPNTLQRPVSSLCFDKFLQFFRYYFKVEELSDSDYPIVKHLVPLMKSVKKYFNL